MLLAEQFFEGATVEFGVELEGGMGGVGIGVVDGWQAPSIICGTLTTEPLRFALENLKTL